MVILSVLISALTIIIFPRLSDIFRIFGVYVVLGACIECISYAFGKNGYNNLIFFHINAFIEFGLLTTFFNKLYEKLGGKSLPILLLPGMVLILMNSLLFQKTDTFNSFSLTFVSLTCIGYSLYYFYLILDKPEDKSELNVFKICVSTVFIQHCISLIILLFSNYLLTISKDHQLIIWLARAVIMLLIKIGLTITFVKLAYTIYIKTERTHVR